MDRSLTTTEQAKLEHLEVTIATGLQSLVEVGRALTQIRDERLYRHLHRTFEEYCEANWGFVRSRARQFIEAAGRSAGGLTMYPTTSKGIT